jgi:hypothetical protein
VKQSSEDSPWTSSFALLVYLAGATLLVHLLAGGRFGFHRDELATLDDARHLAWGYVAYPPLTPFFGRLALQLWGTSLLGFRFFAALAAAVSIVLTGLIARELGGARRACLVAGLAATPFCLGSGSLMQYVAFDYLWWVAVCYFFVRLINSGNPRWWVAVGGAVGFGMLTKYSMLFCAAGMAVGVLLTPRRSCLTNKWLWLGVACSVALFLPNIIWQAEHNFISIDFLRHIHLRDVRIGRTKDFLPDQVTLNLFALPLALAGLCFLFFSARMKQWRALPWFFLVPFALFLLLHGRGYYLAPAYCVLFAAGAVWLDELLRRRRSIWSQMTFALVTLLLVFDIALAGAVVIPVTTINSTWWNFALRNNGDLAEEIGWPELVDTIARVRDSLPESDRQRLAILAANYGEAGAVNLYGPSHHLPPAISGINSFWARGYGDPSPETVIVVGFDREFVDHYFRSADLVAHVSNRYGVANEESTRHPDIFVCRGLRPGWAEFWKTFQRFG